MKPHILILLLTAAGAFAAFDPWPQFRGPNGAGVAETATPPVAFGAAKNVRWKTPVPRGVSSPVFWGDRVFVTGADKKTIYTFALDAATGRELWRQPLPVEKIESCHSFSSPANATPCTDGRRVYVYANSFGVIAYDFDGKEAWRRPLPMMKVQYGSGTSPILAGGKLIVLRDGDTAASHLLALDPATGETAWDALRPFSRNSHATPMVWRHDGVEELIVKGRGRIASYDLAQGEVRWWVPGWGNAALATGVVGDGLLFIGSKGTGDPSEPPPPELDWDKLLAAYDENKDGALAVAEVPADLKWHIRKEVPITASGNTMSIRSLLSRYVDTDKNGIVTRDEWHADAKDTNSRQNSDRFVAIRPGGKGDVTATHLAWESTKGLNEMPSPLFYRGRVYVVADGGRVSVFRPASGERILDREALGAKGQYVASPVAANGLVYFVNEPGEFTVLRAADTLEVVARSELGESVRSTPAFAGSTLFVRALENVWAFSE